MTLKIRITTKLREKVKFYNKKARKYTERTDKHSQMMYERNVGIAEGLEKAIKIIKEF